LVNKVMKKLELDHEQVGGVRLAHVREQGREVDIWDGTSSSCNHCRVVAVVLPVYLDDEQTVGHGPGLM
jgi:hypothetical protein